MDTQPFPVNTIDIACKKILVRPEMADKSKSKDIIIDDPRTSNISQKEIARKAPDDKAKKSGGTGGQAQLMSQARQPGLSITDGVTPTCGQSGAQTDSSATSAGQSAYAQRRQPPHKTLKGKETQRQSTNGRLIKADSTVDQLLSKNTSEKTVLRDRSTKKPQSPAKTKPGTINEPSTTAWPEHHRRCDTYVRTVRCSDRQFSYLCRTIRLCPKASASTQNLKREGDTTTKHKWSADQS